MRALVDRPPPIGAARSGRWSDFARRLVSALVLLPIALICCWLGGAAWIALLVAAAVTLLLEWRAMARHGALPAGLAIGGAVYILVALVSLIWLRSRPIAGLWLVLFLLVAVWATDIGAYLCGRWIGGARMAPAISPAKTWSGAIGGAVAAIAAGLAMTQLPPPLRAWSGWLATGLLALLLSIASQSGDLLESVAKRRCGVKDSGRLIPGHGGLLDRVDGILGAAPLLAALSLLFRQGLVQGGMTPWN